MGAKDRANKQKKHGGLNSGKNINSGLGKTLISSRFSGVGRKHENSGEILRHTLEVADGPSWTQMQSVTHEGHLEKFFNIAQLAGTEFTAERRNIELVSEVSSFALPTAEEEAAARVKFAQMEHFLRIPRRPSWNATTKPAELHQKERDAFLEWRRLLADLEERRGLLVTPFERNIEVWRQLWRVVERSDVVIQIVDARNPLFFRCTDLESYVSDVLGAKRNILLINKADFLTPEQRRQWADYFDKNDIRFYFFSAKLANETAAEADAALYANEDAEEQDEFASNQNNTSPEEDSLEAEVSSDDAGESSANENGLREIKGNQKTEEDDGLDNLVSLYGSRLRTAKRRESDERERTAQRSRLAKTDEDGEIDGGVHANSAPHLAPAGESVRHDYATIHEAETDPEGARLCGESDPRLRILGAAALAELVRAACPGAPRKLDPRDPKRICVGLVGYPNVGKSSTINALLAADNGAAGRRVSVSSTPGKTKHFQTHILESLSLVLCDCPGLVFPSFALTEAEMVCAGVLPIDQLRDSRSPTTLMARRVPRELLEATYGIHIAIWDEQTDETAKERSVPTGPELNRAYALARGYMRATHGDADESRAARYLLKDYVSGKLPFVQPPPDYALSEAEFNGELHRRHLALCKERVHKLGDASSAKHAARLNDDNLAIADSGRFAVFDSERGRELDCEFFGEQEGLGATFANAFHGRLKSAGVAGEILSKSKKHGKGRKGVIGRAALNSKPSAAVRL